MNNIKSNKCTKKLIGLYVIIIIATLPFIASCKTPIDGYSIFVDRNEICKLSFEYPSQYNHRKDGPRVVDYAFGKFYFLGLEPPGIDTTVVIPDARNVTSTPAKVNGPPMSLTIMVTRVDVPNEPGGYQHPTDAKSMLESRVNGAFKNSLNPDFKILERSSIVVSSIQAERVRYVFNNIVQLKGDKFLMIEDSVCFDSGGVIWEISSTCFEECTEQAKADFDHVIQTFKILN
jgi:hypothetical protein